MSSPWTELDYSANELKLIKHFGLMPLVEKGDVSPPKLYQYMVENAFVKNDTTAYAHALRRAVVWMKKCKPRNTPEFEKEIEVIHSPV